MVRLTDSDMTTFWRKKKNLPTRTSIIAINQPISSTAATITLYVQTKSTCNQIKKKYPPNHRLDYRATHIYCIFHNAMHAIDHIFDISYNAKNHFFD